jgi:Flp pilus assembly protein TadD
MSLAEEAYSRNPDSPQAFTLLVNLSLSLHRTDKAMAACEERLRKNPKDAVATYLSGRIHLLGKDPALAAAAAQKAMTLSPSWAEPYLLYIRASLMQGRKDEAVNTLRRYIGADPKNPTPHFALGVLYEQTNDRAKAIETYEAALKKFPDRWPLANNLAFLLAENPRSRADLDRALVLARKAKTINPGDAAVSDTLGWVQYRSGDYPKARQNLEAALGQEPMNPVFNYHLGMVLLKTGDKAGARKSLEAALRSPNPFEGRTEAEKALQTL